MPTPPRLRNYVTAVAVAGAVLVAATASLMLGSMEIDPVATAALFFAAVLSSWIPLRFEHRGGVQGFTLEEGVFVAMLFALPGGLVPLALTGAALIGYASKVRDPVKIAFNVGQIAVWSSAGAAAFHLIYVPGDVLSLRSLVAVLSTALVLNLVSTLLMSNLFRILEGRSFRSSISQTWKLNAVTAVGNTSFGLLLAFVAREDPAATVLASTLMIGLYLGYRGYVGVLEERTRTERLHALSRTLADVSITTDPFSRFLEHIASLFGGGTAELTLFEAQGTRVLTWTNGEVVEAIDVATPPVAAEVLRRSAPALLTEVDGRSHPAVVEAGHRVALAAPLISDGRSVGALVVYDRHGLEPWDDSDSTLLSSLANETVVALRNVELVRSLEDERRRFEDESRKLGDIVGAASDGIAMVTPDGLVTAWNGAMADIVGIPGAQAIGQPWFMVLRLRTPDGSEIPADGATAFHAALQGDRPGQALDLQAMRRDGVWRWLTATFSPVHRGDAIVGTVVVARDITAEREVDELKADFVATVSHELRTPLTPIWGFVETLHAHAERLDRDKIDIIVDGMRKQLVRLGALVDDLLVVADLDRGAVALHSEPVDLAVILEAAVEREVVPERVIHLDGDVSVAVVGDRQALLRIVRGLVNNALKHTTGDVRLEVERTSDEILVHVRDDGPGIAPWDQERIFERFGRLGDHLHRTQGPGLGLSIARALAQQLHGDVTLTSDVGSGSTFTLHLPAAGPRVVRAEDEPRRVGRGDRTG